MYSARFEVGEGAVHVEAAALGPQAASSLVPPRVIDALLDSTRHGLALRLVFQGRRFSATLLISHEESNSSSHGSAATLATTNGLTFAATPEEFDNLTVSVPEHQVWLNPCGYHVGGRLVAADFKLLPLLYKVASQIGDNPRLLLYQVNLRRYSVDREQRRSVQKFLASLRLDSPFPAPLANLQATIARRLLSADFLSDEMLATDDLDFAHSFVAQANEEFQATMSPLGFQRSPIEQGRFDDLFSSGLHSSILDEPRDWLCNATGSLTASEVRRLFTTPIPVPSLDDRPRVGAPRVFLSYSSKDFLEASAIVQTLESQGIGCWIAPRDIPPGQAYPEAIMSGIHACKALVVLLSDASMASLHVHREVERGLNRKAVLIPIRLQELELTGTLDYLLATCHRIDAFGGQLDQALAKLLDRLKLLPVS